MQAQIFPQKKELSVCGRWLEDGTVVEHFLGIIHIKEATAEALIQYLLDFLGSNNISLQGLRGLGIDGTNTMSGERSGVQKRVRLFAPSALYVHCRHQLQLAAIHAANDHNEIKKFFGTLLTIWKAFHYSPKKIEKLIDLEAELGVPELKIGKPSDTIDG